MVNTPIPHSLKSEAKKAAKILREFTMPNSKTGPDKLIPVGIFAKARGLAILTVFKAGFLVTARGGSGIVIAKLRDELDYSQGWSAPSAIGLAGLGGGFEIGMEVTDFVIILNTQAAVDAFSKGGNLTLGGNFTIAVGPLGRNIEGDVALRSPAAIYTYSKTKGIFAGISVEGSALIERKDANRKFYECDIRACEILAGKVSPPEGCEALYQVMREHQELAARAALKLAKRQAAKHADIARDRFAESSGISLPSFSKGKSGEQKSKSSFYEKTTVTRTTTTATKKPSKTYASPNLDRRSREVHTAAYTPTASSGDSRRQSMPDVFKSSSASAVSASMIKPPIPAVHTPARAVAVFPYKAEMSCDLSFSPGDQIEVLTRTDTQDDWWEGKIGWRTGIFPANYVKLV
ncbi:SH3 domain-containing YSC84-like protein 1 isoform X2 [Littorina saxatilis]|uniref:SH3 domain-containing YSC84-like protein 1 n=2 Tax=Littorina saxatilis TaxID=31220 RepID=A0AAN9B5I0_9CAEN